MMKTLKQYVIEYPCAPREREGVTRTYHVPSLGLTVQRIVRYEGRVKTVSYETEDRNQ